MASPQEKQTGIRWRQHEFLLATILTLICIGAVIWKRVTLSPQDLETYYVIPYNNAGLHFNYLNNIIIPLISIILSFYLAFCWVHFIILPGLWAYGHRKKPCYILSIFQLIALILFLGLSWSTTIYYNEEVIYQPAYHDDARRVVFELGVKFAFLTVLVYLAYSSIRELLINVITNYKERRNFRIGICNRITSFMVGYIALPVFLVVFRTGFGEDGYFRFHFFVIPPILLVCLVNIYWIFPNQPNNRFFRWPLIWLLIRLTFLITLPFSILAGQNPSIGLAIFLFFWLAQLLLVTPLSWLIYQQRKDRILQIAGLEKELGESNANLQFLRSQINPHFLFNALNTLYGTALQENAARSAEGIQKLGDMMRFMLHENNQDLIPMQKEVEYLQNYISMQQLRTQSSSSIRIRSEIDDTHCHHQIAPMLLIPFVENAFKHGISLREKSWIDIKLHCDQHSILFEVRNSVHARQDKDPEKDKSGIGMKNVLDRLRLLYPKRHQFLLNGNEEEYYVQLILEP